MLRRARVIWDSWCAAQRAQAGTERQPAIGRQVAQRTHVAICWQEPAEGREDSMARATSLRVAGSGQAHGTVVSITPEEAGWTYIGFTALRLAAGQTYAGSTGEREMALVVLGGICDVESSSRPWPAVGGRPDPFSGRPPAPSLPPHT